MLSRRQELLVGLLRSHADVMAARSSNGAKGSGEYGALLPHSSTCRMRGNGRLTCTCHLRCYLELARCLRVMRGEARPLWYAVYERYVAATRKPTMVPVKRFKPQVAANQAVIGLVNTLDLNTHGNGMCRVLVESWSPRVQPDRVVAGIRWLDAQYRGSPELPVEWMEAA